MLPISDAMLDPIFPARINATMVELNSSIILSLTMYPMSILSRKGFSMLEAVWMTRTPPMKRDMTPTMIMDDIISLSISMTNCFLSIFLFSGVLKACLKNME